MTIPTAAQPDEPVTTPQPTSGPMAGLDWHAEILAARQRHNGTVIDWTSRGKYGWRCECGQGRTKITDATDWDTASDELITHEIAEMVDALGLRDWPHSYQPDNPHVTAAREARAEVESFRLDAAQLAKDLRETEAIVRLLWDATGISRDHEPELVAGGIRQMVDTARITRTQLRPQLARAEADIAVLWADLDRARHDAEHCARERDEARTREAKAVEDATRLRAGITELADEFRERGLPQLSAQIRRALDADGSTPALNSPTTDEPAPQAQRDEPTPAEAAQGESGFPTGEVGNMAVAAEGVMVFMRSERDSGDCICCKGRHVFAHKLDGVSWHDGISKVLHRVPEGARVRILVESTPATETSQEAPEVGQDGTEAQEPVHVNHCAECGATLALVELVSVCPDCSRIFCGYPKSLPCLRAHRQLGTCPDHADGNLTQATPAAGTTGEDRDHG